MKGLLFEGGVRGGGVSVLETLPFQPHSSKIGYDEHRGRKSVGESLHEVNEAEGIDSDASESEDEGYACGICAGKFRAKSPHGLARHIHAKHGQFKGLGQSLRYYISKERGEPEGKTEGIAQSKDITEFLKHKKSSVTGGSSYNSGNKGESYHK